MAATLTVTVPARMADCLRGNFRGENKWQICLRGNFLDLDLKQNEQNEEERKRIGLCRSLVKRRGENEEERKTKTKRRGTFAFARVKR